VGWFDPGIASRIRALEHFHGYCDPGGFAKCHFSRKKSGDFNIGQASLAHCQGSGRLVAGYGGTCVVLQRRQGTAQSCQGPALLGQASYLGTSTFATSQSNVVTGLAGTSIPTVTTETISTRTPAIDQAVQIVASASPSSDGADIATGTMNLYDGANLVSSAPPVSGSATFSESYATSGAHSLSVHYSGDTNFASSQSAATAVTVAACPIL
jgi:hypothetical protein